MLEINKIQDEIIKDFSKLNNWFEKYEYLINNGKKLKPINEKFKSEKYAINGCQSDVRLYYEIRDGRINYFIDSDSLIVKGMISLLLKVLNNQYPKDILNSDLYFIEKTGLDSNLSPSRLNGLMSILKQMKLYAKKN